MKESVANSMVFSIVIIVISIATGIVFFSMGYSKTYKIKNKIIDIIENNGGYNDTNTALKTEIDSYFKSSGYSSYVFNGATCPQLDALSASNTLSTYYYCVYEHETVKGSYYTVKVFMTYDIPLIGDFFKLRYSLRGDTSVIFSM